MLSQPERIKIITDEKQGLKEMSNTQLTHRLLELKKQVEELQLRLAVVKEEFINRYGTQVSIQHGEYTLKVSEYEKKTLDIIKLKEDIPDIEKYYKKTVVKTVKISKVSKHKLEG